MAVTTGCHGYQVPLPYFRIELSSGNFIGIVEPLGDFIGMPRVKEHAYLPGKNRVEVLFGCILEGAAGFPCQ